MKHILSIITVFFIAIIISCSKGDKGESMPVKTTNLTGNILESLSGPSSYAYGGSVFLDLYNPKPGGAKIEILNTNFLAITDNFGNYTISGVPNGYYNFKISKDGFGHVLSKNVIVDTNFYLPYSRISEINKSQLLNIEAEFNNSLMISNLTNNYFNRIKIQPISNRYFNETRNNLQDFIYFFSKKPDVSKDSYEYVYNRTIYFKLETQNINNKLDTLIKAEFEASNEFYNYFKSADTIYVAGYGYNNPFYFYGGDYYDSEKKKQIFTSLNPNKSNVASFVLP